MERPQRKDLEPSSELLHGLPQVDSNPHQLPLRQVPQRAGTAAFCGRASPPLLPHHHVFAHRSHCLGLWARWAACTQALWPPKISAECSPITYSASEGGRRPPRLPARVKRGVKVGGGRSSLQLSLHCLSDLPVCYRAGSD